MNFEAIIYSKSFLERDKHVIFNSEACKEENIILDAKVAIRKNGVILEAGQMVKVMGHSPIGVLIHVALFTA